MRRLPKRSCGWPEMSCRMSRAALERARQEALEAGNSMECLTEELGRLRMDLARQEALASQRGKVITELKDEACTQWASGWLSFQRRAS